MHIHLQHVEGLVVLAPAHRPDETLVIEQKLHAAGRHVHHLVQGVAQIGLLDFRAGGIGDHRPPVHDVATAGAVAIGGPQIGDILELHIGAETHPAGCAVAQRRAQGGGVGIVCRHRGKIIRNLFPTVIQPQVQLAPGQGLAQ